MKTSALKIFDLAKLLPVVLLLMLPVVAQAKMNTYTNSFGIWTYSPSSGPVTINAYSGSVSAVTVPSVINGFPVTSLSVGAFAGSSSMTSVIIPDSVGGIAPNVFNGCASLTTVTMGTNITTLGNGAFSFCTSLRVVFFQGNPPAVNNDATVFSGDTNVVVYFLPTASGWGTTFDDFPTQLWNPQVQTSGASFGVRNNEFGFNVTGNSNLVVLIEASTNLASPAWSPVSTNSLAGGTNYFGDAHWTNFPNRFYRINFP